MYNNIIIDLFVKDCFATVISSYVKIIVRFESYWLLIYIYTLFQSSFMISNTGTDHWTRCVYSNLITDMLCSRVSFFKVMETINIFHWKCIIFIAFHAIGIYDQLLHQFWILHLMILQNWCDSCLICPDILQQINTLV